MTSIQFDENAKTDRVRFRKARKGYFRSLKTSDLKRAEALRGSVDATIDAINQGWLVIPEGADVGTFIVTGGKHAGTHEFPSATTAAPANTPRTLESLFEEYERELYPDSKEAISLGTELIHKSHLLRLLGRRTIKGLDVDALQGYVGTRAREKRLPVTIKKELATLRMAWNWALRRRRIETPVPWRGGDLTFPKVAPKGPFKTRAEIERKIAREQIAAIEAKRLWESL